MSYEQQLNPNQAILSPEEEEDLFDYSYEQPGSIPGTLNIEDDAEIPDIVLIDYTKDRANHFSNLTPEACAKYLETESVSWVDVKGLGSENILKRLGQVFGLASPSIRRYCQRTSKTKNRGLSTAISRHHPDGCA